MTNCTSILTVVIALLFSCQNKEASNTVNGIWQSIGHGQVLEISNDVNYAFYDITSISCLPSRKGSLDELSKNLVLQNDTLILVEGPITYKFIKSPHLPELCAVALDVDKAIDPLYNFEVFMETVKEHYAFLELNAINWDDLYRTQKSKLSEHSTNVELLLTIEETFEKLGDNHAFIEATDEVYTELDAQFGDEVEDELPEFGDFYVAELAVKHFLYKDMTKDSWIVHWGKTANNMGYIQLKAMWLFADLDMSQTRIDSLGYVDAYIEARDQLYEGQYIEKEVEGVARIMDSVMKDLKDTKSIIIDIRFNGGGQDAVSLEVLSRFTSDTIQVATHKFRYGAMHTPLSPVYVEGIDLPYSKPIYLLTSPQTGSAAETFALASLSIPDIKRIGSSTEGAMSTTLDKTLPNGWDFSISNEVYMDNSGVCYENLGVPVDHDLDYPRDRQTFFRSVVNDPEKDKQDILKVIGKFNNY